MADIRILIVDDHTIVRTGISGMLADSEGLVVVGDASNGEYALRLIADLQPDVVLMDLRMPVLDGPTTIERLRSSGNQTPVLVLTTYDTDSDILRAIESGANGYLLKDATREELISGIRAVAAGQSWLTPSVASRVMTQMQTRMEDPLSSRELDVLRLVARGDSNKEIAAQLNVSQATIKSHLIHIFRKLEVTGRTAAVTVALDRGIITIP